MARKVLTIELADGGLLLGGPLVRVAYREAFELAGKLRYIVRYNYQSSICSESIEL